MYSKIDQQEQWMTSRLVRRAFVASWVLLVVCALYASAFHFALPDWNAKELGSPVSFIMFATQDDRWLWVVVVAMPAAWWLTSLRQARTGHELGFSQLLVISIAVLVTVIVAAGTQLVFRDFALSMDEFMLRYQSVILQRGYLVAPVDSEMLSIASAQRPGFLIVDAEHKYWAPGYRPGTAILHATFSRFGLDWLMNAFFCGASIILVAAIARKTLPNVPGATVWAAVFLASSPQFLLTGMTPYTMTAHLLASLLWLYLFLLDRPVTHVLAMLVGAMAIGLHQINVHLMFALPFLIHLLFWRRNWRLAACYSLIYATALGGWIFWMDIAAWVHKLDAVEVTLDTGIGGGAEYLTHVIDSGMERFEWKNAAYWAMNLSRFLAWQNAIAIPFFVLTIVSWRHLPVQLKLMAWSIVTTLAPYIALMPDQGHGWGYRYLHPVLGNMAILATFGLLCAASAMADRLRHLAVLFTALTILIALPLRANQANFVITPMEGAMKFVRSRDADTVLVDTSSIWYGNDLVRNDPFLRNRPLILAVGDLSDQHLTILCENGSINLVNEDNLSKFGIKGNYQPNQGEKNTALAISVRLKKLGCID